MQRLSKRFFVGSIVGGLGLGILLAMIGATGMMSSHGRSGAEFMLMAWLPMMYGLVVMLVLFYKMWAAIQDGHARTSPGKAVGFLLIPLFNLYWAFQAIWGFAKDYNAYLDRHSIRSPKLPGGLFLAYVILALCAVIPLLGLLLAAVNFVIGILMVIKICDAVNALPTAPSAPVAPAGKEAGRMALANRLSSAKHPRAESQQQISSEHSTPADGKLITETEHFLLLEMERPAAIYIMLLREATVNQVAAGMQGTFEEAAKHMAGQFFILSRGPATKEEIVRGGAEIFQKAWVDRYPSASAVVASKVPPPSSWDVPVVAVCWQR